MEETDKVGHNSTGTTNGWHYLEWRRSFGAVEVVIRLSLSPLPNVSYETETLTDRNDTRYYQSGTAGAGSQEADNHDWQGSDLGRDTRLPSTTDEIIKIYPRWVQAVVESFPARCNTLLTAIRQFPNFGHGQGSNRVDRWTCSFWNFAVIHSQVLGSLRWSIALLELKQQLRCMSAYPSTSIDETCRLCRMSWLENPR